ncbi:FAD-binding protein [Candidatus Bathyarchaeota archaeon]|nr:MAG: FAD-binding protein [Candidatus Bathyarchaeota archaeon]
MLQEDVEDYDVVIAGGGIGGLAFACGLAGNGRKTCVLESRPNLVRSKRGLALQPNGLAALDNLGLLTQVLGIGKRTNSVAWWEIGHGKLATFDYSILDHPHNFLLTIIPSDIRLLNPRSPAQFSFDDNPERTRNNSKRRAVKKGRSTA